MIYKKILLLLSLTIIFSTSNSFAQKREKLLSILGRMPQKSVLHVDTLEKIKLKNG
jgi:hypothetical protein